MDLYCNTTNEMLYNIPIHLISTVFQPFFASTIAGFQGANIEQPFSIWEMDKTYLIEIYLTAQRVVQHVEQIFILATLIKTMCMNGQHIAKL